jgi:hypothetical protein
MKKLGFLALSLICFSAPAFAYTYDLRGAGTGSCGTWTSDRAEGADSSDALQDGEWVLGFVSGFEDEEGYSKNENFKITTDYQGIYGWIDNYCRTNPTETISDAAEAFVDNSGSVVPGD